MKPSEYGGSDTHETAGIQPSPHVLTADEKLRVLYLQDPSEELSEPIAGIGPTD